MFTKICFFIVLLSGSFAFAESPAKQPSDHLVFEPTNGSKTAKHIVFLAGDEEYRSEEALPMLAQLMARHGFKCTVLFSMDNQGKFVAPKNIKSLSNPAALDSADLIVVALRFRLWKDEAMQKFVNAFERGIPIVSLRTSVVAFHFKEDSKWKKYSWKNGRKKHWQHDPAEGWKDGFGREVLGETWFSHHGKHKIQGTRSKVAPGADKSELLRGVGTIFAETDVYGANPQKDSNILLLGAVTESLEPDSKEVTGRRNSPMQPIAWTRIYKHPSGTTNKVFTTTLGASTDFDDAHLRRLVANAIFWGCEFPIPEKLDVSISDKYQPTFYGVGKHRENQTPSDYVLPE